MTQEELAERTHVSVHHISRIETGRALPGLQLFVNIVNCLQLSADELLCESVTAARPYLLKETEELAEGLPAEELLLLQEMAKAMRRRQED